MTENIKLNNRKIGNDFEKEFCEILADNGYWVHNFALKTSEGIFMLDLSLSRRLAKTKKSLDLTAIKDYSLRLEVWL